MLATRWLHRDAEGSWHLSATPSEITDLRIAIEEIEARYRGYPDNQSTRVTIAIEMRELIFGQATRVAFL